MKSTRKYILAVCALALGFIVPAVHAEEGSAPPAAKKQGPGGGNPIEHILKLKEKLGLTEDQVAKLQKIGDETRTAMKALREKEGDADSKKAERKKLMESTKAKIDAVLTAEQKAKLEEMRKAHEEGAPGAKGEKGPKDGKGPKGPAPEES